MRFRLYWLSGKTQVVTGDNITDACHKAGIGLDAAVDLDRWSQCAEDTLHTGVLAVTLDAVQTVALAAREIN